MAKTTASQFVIPQWIQGLQAYQSLLVPIGFIMLLVVIVVPLPTAVMDLLLGANLAIASLVLMTTIFVERPLDFSVFPSLLLGTTLFRLVLNIATTRMILGSEATTAAEATGSAGRVIQAFSEFVAGSSPVVGAILFIILVIVQFVVITKGSTRISEVAARFTLDAMPGKQMAIDADLNAGLITEQQARERREQIAQEADFYGAMDGAAKFVRGDAIAGIIITVVNIVGGFAIGVAMKGWTITESIDVYTRLTIGDGIVSQLPAFVIAVAAGLIVTRSSSRSDLGSELGAQLTRRVPALGITAGFLVLMALTGLPMLPMLVLAGTFGTVAFLARRSEKQVIEREAKAAKAPAAKPEPAPVEQAIQVDMLELEVGYGLVRLVDQSQGGDLLDRISAIRRQLASEMGIVMPPVRIRDNMQLQQNDYRVKIRGNTVASGVIYPGQFMAMDGGLASEKLPGTPTREPAFGLEAVWIDAGQKQRAESINYTVVDATSVLATHITEVVKTHASELLTREETNNLIEQLKQKAPKLTEEVLTGEQALLKPGELQKVLQNLLSERVPVRDLETIVETLGDLAGRTKDLDVLTEYARNALRRTICHQYATQEVPETGDVGDFSSMPAPVTRLYCVSLDPALEDQINGFIERTAEGTSMSMPPALGNRIASAIAGELERLVQVGRQPVILTSPQVRAQVRRLIEPHIPIAAVLGYNEISKGVEVESVGLVSLGHEAAGVAAGQTEAVA
ncbi:flagellar biosynthesis protein FlhA [Mucisphaera calidilacus]|uniref:Flagellar biosynthesis protein FlhA n=1 Tax=Mucisphaera calidilacus TaxID=2527982 RepID=A0A518BYX1_9BACT|nr:flagellar biosynthesis protein FlhA [Mucisphaera calidilacus]QDU72172.1 Flagellar biosynthesis protein FlhA [Mucisphaera calidilacus]